MQAHEPELAGWVETPATSTPWGSNSAPEVRLGQVGRNPSGRTSTRASTATGLAVDHDQRVEVGRHDRSGRPAAASDSPEQHVDQRRAIDRRLAPELAQQLLRGEVVDQLLGVDPPISGTSRKATSATASARMPPTPEHHGHAELRVVVQAGDQLPVARSPSGPPAGRPRRPRAGRPPAGLGGGRGHRGGVAQAEPHEPPLGLVGDGVAAQLRATTG